MMTEDGVKIAAGADYRNKFRDIIWTSDINRELPIMMNRSDLSQKTSETIKTPPGQEPAQTISQAFLHKVNLYQS